MPILSSAVQDVSGSHHECFALAGSEFKRSRQRNHVLRLRGSVPTVRGVRGRFLEMDGDYISAIHLVDRAFKHMRCIIGPSESLMPVPQHPPKGPLPWSRRQHYEPPKCSHPQSGRTAPTPNARSRPRLPFGRFIALAFIIRFMMFLSGCDTRDEYLRGYCGSRAVPFVFLRSNADQDIPIPIGSAIANASPSVLRQDA